MKKYAFLKIYFYMYVVNFSLFEEPHPMPMVKNVSFDNPNAHEPSEDPPSPGIPHSAVLLDGNNIFHSIVSLNPPLSPPSPNGNEPAREQSPKSFMDTNHFLSSLSKFQKSLLAAHEEQASNDTTEKKSQGSFPFALKEGVNVQIRSAAPPAESEVTAKSNRPGLVRLFEKSEKVPQALSEEQAPQRTGWFKRKQQFSEEPPQAGYYHPQSPVKYLSPAPGSP